MRGLGLNPDEWGLHNLANKKHVTGFLDFLAERTGYTDRMRVIIKFVQSLLRPQTGYLWQANGIEWTRFPPEWLEPSLGSQPLTLEVWRSHCEQVHANLRLWLKDLMDGELIELNRDYSHIEPILEMDWPMDALTMLEERLVAYVEGRRGKVSDLDFAVDMRDMVLTLMMIRNPLRAHHWEIMTWTPHGTGHLRRTESGYELRFARHEFKALSGIWKKKKKKEKEYRAMVAPELTELLDEYLLRWRPLLPGSRTSDRVFVSSVLSPNSEEE
jgi:hypothetical protein